MKINQILEIFTFEEYLSCLQIMDHCLVVVKQLEAMSHAMQGHPRQTVIVENSDKTWSTRGGNGKPLQYSCCENPISCIKRQKDMTPKDKPPAQKEEQKAITNSPEQLTQWKRP